MNAPLNLFARASIVSIILITSISAGADQARVKLAVTETSRQTIGPAGEQQGPPPGLQMAQQCQSGRDDCMERPQEQCGPGLNDCLSLGYANCKDDAANATGSYLGPAPPNTTGLDNALKNPNLTPEQRAKFEDMKARSEATHQRSEQVLSRLARARANGRAATCFGEVVKQCRATHC
jgi:hypothetical protein